MTVLPAYRRLHLRIMVRAAAGGSRDVSAALARALERFGVLLELTGLGPYYREPELLEFAAVLEPSGPVEAAVAALRATAPVGWSGEPDSPGWVRPDDGTQLLHPELRWATVSPEQAATAPRYVSGDLVRILDCPSARREGLVAREAEIRGHAPPLDDGDVWGYAVRPAGWDTLICFDEPELAPTGRRAPERSTGGVLGVRPDGTVSGYSAGP